MVQRKVSNKLGIHPKNTLKTHANTKLSLLNHDTNTKVVDNIKAIKMKKSRSTTKRPEIDFSRNSSTTSHVTPTKTPSPKKPSPYKVVDLKAIKMKKSRSLKQPDIEFSHRLSMKSDEVSTPVTPIKTPSPKKQCFHSSPNYMKSTRSSDHHKAEKTPGKTSSLKKVRTLTKAPSFKHSRMTHKKAVLCENNYDAQRATCSSTLKEFKFPSYLKLTPGATESEGTSVMKVCPYTYCSLNGHRHSSPPPLNTFLASKRRMLKNRGNVKPEVVSPGKRKCFEIQVTDDDSDKDFFVEIHVPRYDPSQVSEIGFQDAVNLSDMNFIFEENGQEITDGINTSEMNFSSEENRLSLLENEGSSDGYPNASDPEMDSDSSVSLDRLFGEVSDMEWEEGHILGFPDEEVEFPIQEDCGDDDGVEVGFELEKFAEGKLLPCIYDEIIMEFLQFSDADTALDTESAQTDTDLDYIVEQIADDESICTTKVVEGSFEDEASSFSNLIEENENSSSLVKDASSEEESDSTEVKFGSTQSYVEEAKTSEEAKDIIKSENEEELTITINKPEQVYSSELWKSVRCKKTDEDSDEDKDFNPRPPNFLPAEPEEEPERVDLRHQDMDERRNAEDWMLDHALQRTVGQLAPARKRKVALLVEAFEAVIPVPKYEPHIRRNSSGFSFARPVQACSR